MCAAWRKTCRQMSHVSTRLGRPVLFFIPPLHWGTNERAAACQLLRRSGRRPSEGFDLKYFPAASRRNWGRGWARKESPQNFNGKCCKETSGGASFSSGLQAPFFFCLRTESCILCTEWWEIMGTLNWLFEFWGPSVLVPQRRL